MTFAPDYIDVAQRIREFRAAHPNGSLRPANVDTPYRVETIGDRTFIVYVAAAYRTADDPCPGVGSAWEPFPGLTNFTRNSELQNAETSAWGRAIVAALAADTKQVATAEDVRNREAEPAPLTPDEHAGTLGWSSHQDQADVFHELVETTRTAERDDVKAWVKSQRIRRSSLSKAQADTWESMLATGDATASEPVDDAGGDSQDEHAESPPAPTLEGAA